jgi:hypothetical protein
MPPGCVTLDAWRLTLVACCVVRRPFCGANRERARS